MKHIISLGAGVQSSTIALMAAHSEIGPMPDAAIFADTGWEPQGVYDWLDWLKTQLPFPVLTVQRPGSNLGDLAIKVTTTDTPRDMLPPFYLDKPFGMLPIQCSKEFKARPVQNKIREIIGLAPKQRGPKDVVVTQWLGISLEESHRMRSGEVKFIENRYPLIEQRMTRQECLLWMDSKGYPMPPKSSCVFCPFKGDKQWMDMRDKSPDDWQKAVAFDATIRRGYRGMEGFAYLHKQRVPLDQVKFRHEDQPNMFGNECEGMCGV